MHRLSRRGKVAIGVSAIILLVSLAAVINAEKTLALLTKIPPKVRPDNIITKTSMVSEDDIASYGPQQTWRLTLGASGPIHGSITGRVQYTVHVKSDPAYAVVHALVQERYYDTATHTSWLTGIGFFSARRFSTASAHLPCSTRGYYIQSYHVITLSLSKSGSYWIGKGEWFYEIKSDRVLCPDGTVFQGTLSVYGAVPECTGPLCG